MYARQPLPRELTRLALAQDGAVSREQSLGCGLTRDVLARLLDSGTWVHLSRGVYATVPGAVTWATRAWAGVLIGGDHARLGPSASGHLIELVADPPDPIDVFIPNTSVVRRPEGWRFIRETPGIRSRSVGSPPRLGNEDTMLDLAAVGDEARLITLVTEALRMRLTTPRRLRRALDGRLKHRHRKLLSQLLDDVDGIESALELDYRRLVERPHGLPRSTPQVVDPRWRYRRDLLYDEYALFVELDGRLGHKGEGAFRDMTRDNRAVLTGRVTMRFGWWHVHGRPCGAAITVHQVLVDRGFSGLFTRCARCIGVPDDELKLLAA